MTEYTITNFLSIFQAAFSSSYKSLYTTRNNKTVMYKQTEICNKVSHEITVILVGVMYRAASGRC